MENNMLVLMSIVLVVGLLGVLAIEGITVSQEAEAKGCRNSVAFNASQGRCFAH
jgi:hypothetical protein